LNRHRPKPSPRTQTTCSAFSRALVLLLLMAAAPVRAQDDSTRAAARALGTQGIEAYWANDFDTANTKLDRAFRLYATATLGLWSARARAQLGQLVGAAERYREALRATLGESDAQQKAQDEARSELDALQPRIPSLTIRVSGVRSNDQSVTVMLDDTEIPSALFDEKRPTDPGHHLVVATRGSERQQIEVQLREREARQLEIQFRAQPEPAGLALAPPPQPVAAAAPPPPVAAAREQVSPLAPIGVISMAFGGAGLVTAGVTALIANSKRADCPEDVCTPEIKESYDAFRTVSTVAFYAGAGLAVGGLVMWLVAPNAREDAAAVSWHVGPGGVALTGAF
jgi:hypothetical protein